MWSRLLIAAGVALTVAATSANGFAQNGGYSYEKAFKRLNSKPYDPDADIERSLRKQGLQPNGMLKLRGRSGELPDTTQTENGLLRRFDADGDGEITRDEYVKKRMRSTNRLGSANGLRDRHNRIRLHSRFRAADRNRDGKLSRSELGNIGDPRF